MNDEIKEIHISFPGQILDYVDTKEHLLDLFNYITNLEQKVEQYENPDDYTLFYMWLDTRAKDKFKQMEHEVISLKQQNAMITKLGEDYKSRNKKAIEYIKSYKNDYAPYELSDYNIRELLNILGGD